MRGIFIRIRKRSISDSELKKYTAIIKVTALEILSEPVALLLLLSALVLAIMAPAFHYHQFGEATRMSLDAGFSALFVAGSVFAVSMSIKSFRKEIESGTLDMVLSHSVSRSGFFLAKFAGVLLSFLVFAFIVFSVTTTVVNGASIGAMIAEDKCDIARLWGPSFACAMASIVLPMTIGGLLNWKLYFRFVPTVFMLTLPIALAGMVYRFDSALFLRLLPVGIAIACFDIVFLAAGAAFASRFKTNVAIACTTLTVVAFLPFVGNHILTDVLSKNGSVDLKLLFFSLLLSLAAIVAFLISRIRQDRRIAL